MNHAADHLVEVFSKRQATVSVVGLGYVGLPLAVEIAKAGFATFGYDISEERVARINRGESPVLDVLTKELDELVTSDRLRATTDPEVLARSDVVIICVPTPLQGNKEPDMKHIISATGVIAKYSGRSKLVVLESTSYPGTTDDLIAGMFRSAGWIVDRDVFLAFSPERVDPGNKRFTTKTIPKVVGGVSETSTVVANAFYEHVLDKVHPVASARVAETSKLLENTFRAVNIAMVNELAQLCHVLNVNVWDVIEAAKTKPFGFMAFYPGPGIGGHCIPLDPHYLAWSARLTGFEPRFIHVADQVNSTMPRYVVTRATELLNDHCRPLRGSNTLVFGVAYKKDVDDARESPAVEVLHLLEDKGANVRYVDPFVSHVSFKTRTWTGSEMNDDLLDWADFGIVLTDHSQFDWPAIVDRLDGPILDTRNAVALASTKVVKL